MLIHGFVDKDTGSIILRGRKPGYPVRHGVPARLNKTLGHFRRSFMYFFVKPNDNLVLR